MVVIGGAADMLLFFAIFNLLVRPRLPQRSLWAGALLGAIGAELLKWLSSFLIGLTRDQPAFQAFGIALILLVWINYFSRVVRVRRRLGLHHGPARRPDGRAGRAGRRRGCGRGGPARRSRAPYATRVPPSAWVGSGAAMMLALVALLRRRKRD